MHTSIIGRRRSTTALVTLSSFLLLLTGPAGTGAQTQPPAQTLDAVRVAATYTGVGGSSSTVYYYSVDAAALAAGQEVTFQGVIQTDDGESTSFSSVLPAGALSSYTLSPAEPTGPTPKTTYAILENGMPTAYTLTMTTDYDAFKLNTLVHSGIVTNTSTGEITSFVALNDPVPVIAIIGGIAVLLLCGVNIIMQLANSCTSQAIAACGQGNVKRVETRVTAWSLLGGCRSNCYYECFCPPHLTARDGADGDSGALTCPPSPSPTPTPSPSPTPTPSPSPTPTPSPSPTPTPSPSPTPY